MLFTFPSRYWFAIGLTGVFSLAGWARRIQAGLHVSRPTQESALPRRASRKGLSPAAARLSRRFRSRSECNPCGPTTPAARRHAAGLGYSPVARRYWGNHSYFPFLRVLRCFSSPGWPSPIKGEWPSFRRPGCPIRISADQRSSAPTRGLSQLVTSFIASVSLGIRHPPSTTFHAEHTFGCRMQPPPSRRRARSHRLRSLYSLACVNMSKIS